MDHRNTQPRSSPFCSRASCENLDSCDSQVSPAVLLDGRCRSRCCSCCFGCLPSQRLRHLPASRFASTSWTRISWQSSNGAAYQPRCGLHLEPTWATFSPRSSRRGRANGVSGTGGRSRCAERALELTPPPRSVRQPPHLCRHGPLGRWRLCCCRLGPHVVQPHSLHSCVACLQEKPDSAPTSLGQVSRPADSSRPGLSCPVMCARSVTWGRGPAPPV